MGRVIIFSGKKQSGKDSCADYIGNKLISQGKTVGFTAFAKPLKNFCKDVLGLTAIQCYGTDKQKDTLTQWLWDDVDFDIRMKYSDVSRQKWRLQLLENQEFANQLCIKGPMTARQVLQVFGTDIMRDKFNRNIWALGAMNIIKKMEEDYIFITDARFPNEIEIAKDKDFLIIRLHRLNYPRTDDHFSEIALDDYPIENYNYYIEAENLEQLFSQIDEAMKKEGVYAS